MIVWRFGLVALLLTGLSTTAPARGEVSDQRLVDIVRGVLIDSLPPSFEEKKNWDNKVSIFDGFDITGKGLKVKIRERKKPVNHGKWQEFRATPVEPEKKLTVRLSDFRREGSDTLRFRLTIGCPFRASAKETHWNNGIRLFTLEADADVAIEADFDLRVKVGIVRSGRLPAVTVQPSVENAQVRLTSFRMRKVGNVARGEVALELGRVLRRTVIERMLDKENRKLTAKANTAIAKATSGGTITLSASKLLPTTLVKKNG